MADIKTRIEQMVADLSALDPYSEMQAARSMLHTQQTDVIYELAAAALVDAARRRRRAGSLAVERSAEIPEVMTERPRQSNGRPVRRGTSRYWKWVEESDEGKGHEAAMAAADAAYVAGLARVVSTAVDEYADALRIEWTNELLATEIALPDGTRTTWGAATVEQHTERAQMFERMAQGNLEGAARHRKAIDELRSSGASSLSAMTQEVAA